MHKFYFNDFIEPSSVSINEFIELLILTIKEYELLVNKKIGVDRNVILPSETSKIKICGTNLRDIIVAIPNREREYRSLAYSYFTKYPIDEFLKSNDFDDKILEEDYQYESKSAINLAIAYFNNCFLFSIATDNLIKKNSIELTGNSEKITIDNLFGEKQNTEYVECQINELNSSSVELFEQLKAKLGNTFYNISFEKEFKSLSETTQKTIISLFERAKNRHLRTPYMPDTNLIKDVSPEKNTKKVKVYELREKEEGIRVYFYEQEDIIYLASIAYKKNYKDESGSAQSKDIKKALNLIDVLSKTK